MSGWRPWEGRRRRRARKGGKARRMETDRVGAGRNGPCMPQPATHAAALHPTSLCGLHLARGRTQ